MTPDVGTPRAHLTVSANVAYSNPLTEDRILPIWASATWRWDGENTWTLEEFVLSGRYAEQKGIPAGRKWHARPGSHGTWQVMPEDVRPIAEALRPNLVGIPADPEQ